MLLLSDDKNIKFLSLLACADLCSICQAVFWSINKDSNSSVGSCSFHSVSVFGKILHFFDTANSLYCDFMDATIT